MAEAWTYTLGTGCGTSEDSSKKTCAVKRVSLLIDSRDRDYARHPSASSYVVKLPSHLFNVTSAMLKSIELPTSYYVFTAGKNNTSLVVSVGGVTRTITIPDGNYSFNTMSTALSAALGAAFPGSSFSVTFSDATYRINIAVTPSAVVAVDCSAVNPITTPTQFGLAYFLGFPAGVITSGTGNVSGTSVASLNPETYLLVDIEELNTVQQAGMWGRGGSSGTVFAKVPITNPTMSVTVFDKLITASDYVPPIARLESLRISLRFHDGSLVDFHGCEHSMTLELACTQSR